MDAVQLDIFAELEKASDSRRPNLCRSWKNAVLNDHGVFIENRVDIEVTKTKKTFYPRVTIHCAMEYPKVYYSFDICGLSAGGGGYPGHYSRHFDVHEHVANVTLMMEHELRARAKGKDITDKMINECVEKFKAAITSDVSEYTTECECRHVVGIADNCSNCPANGKCSHDYWTECGDAFLEWANEEAEC